MLHAPMTRVLPAALLALSALLPACAPTRTGPMPDPATYRPGPGDTVTLPDLGPVGRWMITKTLEPATWLGERTGGRTLREPINVLILDRAAATPEAATARLNAAMTAAGYGPKNMHSDGYSGQLGDRLYPQLPPSGQGLAFSDGPWYASNHHGRVFGPAPVQGGYLFSAAVSREDMRWLPTPGHTYNSFTATREDLAARLAATGLYTRAANVDLGNRLDTPQEATGDHDGQAALLTTP